MDHVVFPERDIADRVVRRLMVPDLLEHIPLSAGTAILEVPVPASFVGRSIMELEIRTRFHVYVIGVKRRDAASRTPQVELAPTPATTFRGGDVLLVLGTTGRPGAVHPPRGGDVGADAGGDRRDVPGRGRKRSRRPPRCAGRAGGGRAGPGQVAGYGKSFFQRSSLRIASRSPSSWACSLSAFTSSESPAQASSSAAKASSSRPRREYAQARLYRLFATELRGLGGLRGELDGLLPGGECLLALARG